MSGFQSLLDFGIVGEELRTCSYPVPRVLSRLTEEEKCKTIILVPSIINGRHYCSYSLSRVIFFYLDFCSLFLTGEMASPKCFFHDLMALTYSYGDVVPFLKN